MTKFEDPIHPNILRLVEAHPQMFRGKPPRIWSDLPDGWYSLVDQLCTDIEASLSPEEAKSLKIQQIKEKYAGLRFYFKFGRHEDRFVDVATEQGIETYSTKAGAGDEQMNRIRDLVSAATTKSEITCQTCGQSGETRNLGGYLVTLCDQHFDERVKQRAAKWAQT